MLPYGHMGSIDQASQQARELDTNFVAVLRHPTIAESPPVAIPVKVKKRRLVLRKARNLAARRIVLKATLGRELAVPIKEALRRLAKGDCVRFTDISVIG